MQKIMAKWSDSLLVDLKLKSPVGGDKSPF